MIDELISQKRAAPAAGGAAKRTKAADDGGAPEGGDLGSKVKEYIPINIHMHTYIYGTLEIYDVFAIHHK